MTPLPAGHLAGSGERSAFEEGAQHPRRVVGKLIDKKCPPAAFPPRRCDTAFAMPDSKELQQQDRETASGDHAIDVDVTRAEPPALEVLTSPVVPFPAPT
jgi:hypothetical protein